MASGARTSWLSATRYELAVHDSTTGVRARNLSPSYSNREPGVPRDVWLRTCRTVAAASGIADEYRRMGSSRSRVRCSTQRSTRAEVNVLVSEAIVGVSGSAGMRRRRPHTRNALPDDMTIPG
jgi:hypothetical protein